MPKNPPRMSGRVAVSTGGTLLAGYRPPAARPGAGVRSPASLMPRAPWTPSTGEGAEPLRIAVDLRVECEVRSVTLVLGAAGTDEGSVAVRWVGPEGPELDFAATEFAASEFGEPESGEPGAGGGVSGGRAPSGPATGEPAFAEPELRDDVLDGFGPDGRGDGEPGVGGGEFGPAATGGAVALRVETSLDGRGWRTVREVEGGPGGVRSIVLDEPVAARWVRMTATPRPHAGPLGLGGFQVYGTCSRERPAAAGWTVWDGRPAAAPAGPARTDGVGPAEPGRHAAAGSYGPPPPDTADDERLPDAYVRAVDDRLGTSSSAAAFRRKAQFVDYERMRALAEAANAPLRQVLGTPVPLLPRLPHVMWPAHDLGGGYYGARKGREPLHIQAGPGDGRVSVANRSAEPVHAVTAAARLYDLGGRPLGDPLTRTFDVAASAARHAFTMPFGRRLPATHLLRLRLTDAHGRVLSANDYWRYRTPQDMRALNGLPVVGLSLRARTAGRTAVTATVTNTGGSPAAMVKLSLGRPDDDPGLDGADGSGPDGSGSGSGEGQLAAPADDNYFWLLPGESREVTLSWAAAGAETGAPRVLAEAYNALRVTADTVPGRPS